MIEVDPEIAAECDCVYCRTEKAKLKRGNKQMNEARQKREEFRARLAEAGFPEHTTYSSKVLEAYDLVHCPELRKKPTKVSFDSKNYPDGLIIEVDGINAFSNS